MTDHASGSSIGRRRIDEPRTGRRGECELQRRVAERPREDVAESAHGHPATELDDEAGDPSPTPAGTDHPEQQADREDQRNDQEDGGAGWTVEEVDTRLEVELAAQLLERGQDSQQGYGDHERQQRPATGHAGVTPVAPETHKHQRNEHEDTDERHSTSITSGPRIGPEHEDVADAGRCRRLAPRRRAAGHGKATMRP